VVCIANHAVDATPHPAEMFGDIESCEAASNRMEVARPIRPGVGPTCAALEFKNEWAILCRGGRLRCADAAAG
jgi:hypothetical protein